MQGRHPTWYAFGRWVVKNFYFGLKTGGLKAVNEHYVPRSGPTIVAPIHLSYLDPPAVACATRRRLRFLAKEELWHNRFLGGLISSFGGFPVRRGESDTESIRKSISVLEDGEALMVFPEGTRGDGEHLQPINRGVAMLAKRTGAAVVPIIITGSNVVMPRGGGKSKRHLITIVFGEPFSYAQVAGEGTERQGRDRFTKALEERLLALARTQGLELKSESSVESRSDPANPVK